MQTTDTIKADLIKQITEYEAKITLWKNVKRLTKKDGSDFKIFSKNFGNAIVYSNYMGRNALKVNGWIKDLGYIEDEIGIWDYVDNTDLNPEEHTIIQEAIWSRPYFYLTVDEIFAEINKIIEIYERNISSYRDELNKVDEVFTEFTEAIDAALAKLREKAGDRTTLYYECREYMKHAI